MNNSNNKKFYDRTNSYILLFSLVVGMPFFINICVIVMKISISAYSHIIFCYITHIHSKLKECVEMCLALLDALQLFGIPTTRWHSMVV